MDRDEVNELLARLREAVRDELLDPEQTASWVVLERLDALVHAAEPARLLGGVRIGRDDIYDLLDQIRSLLPEEIRRSAGY